MWLMTNFGFFSIVQKADDKSSPTLTIRSRSKKDLETLRDKYLPQLGPIKEGAGTDYRYRAKAPKADLAIALLQITQDIDYSNFKDSVQARQGQERADLYHKVWSVLYQLKESKPVPVAVAKPQHPSSDSFGGILFDEQGRVLLRKPTKGFGGYTWTFAKGKRDGKEAIEKTALREVLEETGYKAEILAVIPGSFKGTTGRTEYFLMRPIGKQGQPDPIETEATEWVHIDKAPDYIKQTPSDTRRDRDLKILRAAVETHKKWQAKNS